MLTIQSIIESVYGRWSEAVSQKVGSNYSMENSNTVSKLPYANMYFMGMPTAGSVLEGGETGINSTLQVDVYTKGQRSLSEAYEIDQLSHSALVGMGYTRSYGPELLQNIDPSIKRLSSRYTRVWGYGDKFPD